MRSTLILGMVTMLAGGAEAARLTVVNYSSHAIPAAAVTVERQALAGLGLPVDQPLRASIVGRAVVVPVEAGVRSGKPVARFYVSLGAQEKIELDVVPATAVARAAVASAKWDSARHEGTVTNGVVTFRLKDNKWDLLLGDAALILSGGGYYGWLDDRRRGRVSDTRGFDPSKDDSRDPGPEGAGMISTRTAHLVRSSAAVLANGDVEVRIEKSFGGYASHVVWTEAYTLSAGLPLLKYRMRFENRGDAPVYVAYVGRGGWVYARYGPGLANVPRLFSDQKAVNDVPLGGESVRIAWIPEHAWSGIESDSGTGLAISTLHKIPNTLMTGSMVWQFSASSFSLPLVEHAQGQYPWVIEKGKPVKAGIAFLVTSGNTPVAPDGRALINAMDRGADPETSAAYAVLAGDRVLEAATVNGPVRLTGAPVLGALQADFAKNYLLDATLSQLGVISAVPLDNAGSAVTLGQHAAGKVTIDLNAVTGWKGVRSFVLRAPEGTVTAAELRRKPFDAPEIISPADNVSITDLAFYLKWRPRPDARGYDLQIARDASFTGAEMVSVKGVTHYMPADLPATGRWFWRVRATAPGISGEWTAARNVTVNATHGKAPILRTVSVDRPLFTIEAGDNSDFNKLAKAIPEDLKQYFAVVVGDKVNLPQLLAPARDHGIAVMLRTHHPSAVDGWTPLASVEAVFQQFPNVIGIQGGEALGSWYGDKENARYIQRLVQIALKYGRIVHEGDGCYDENKWKEIYDDPVAGKLVRENSPYIIFSQKNNIFNKQLMTQSAVLGQYLAGTIGNSGAWEDGGWYWAQVGFRKLGESYGARSGKQRDMPQIFWDLTFLMGVARGATVYSMDGQGGVYMRGKYDLSNPEHHNAVLWSGEGQQTEAFQRYVLPFLHGVIAHKMLPTREQVLANVKLAVTFDGAGSVTKFQDDRYREFWALYAGTYGFHPQGAARGEVIEFFPNTGRYFYIPIIPPGTSLKGVRSVPIAELQDPAKVRAMFNERYPKWYEGDALVSLTGDTLAVMNTHENEDVTESYSVPVSRGMLHSIGGKVAVHSYLMGKFEAQDRKLWLQTNTNYPDRDTELTLACDREPMVAAMPASGIKTRVWDAAHKELKLVLSHTAGAVELNVEIAK